MLRVPRLKPVQWLALAGGTVVVLAIAFFVLRETGALAALRNLPVQKWVRDIAILGPVPFLIALALLPAIGAPVTLFYVIAAAVFAENGGLGMALIGCFAAITCNIALTYALGRWLMHPVIARFVRRFGWQVPKVRHEDRWAVTLLLRITPGPPFFVQSYLLALGRVPFGSYMLVSTGVAWLMSAPVIIFGESLASGSSSQLILGALFIVAVIIAVRFVRRRLARRRPDVVAEAAGREGAPAPDQPPSASTPSSSAP